MTCSPTRLCLTTVLLVVVGAGCGADHPATTSSPSATGAQSPSAATGVAADATAAYRSMWDSFVEAGKTSDPDAPEIRRYASGQALRLIVSALVTNRDQGKVIRGDLVINPKVTTATPTEVTIVDCVNDEQWLVYKTSGGLADDKPGGRHRTTATVRKTDAGWKVASFILKDAGTC
jgi:hypothetical protein